MSKLQMRLVQRTISPEKLITVREAAEMLALSEKTVYNGGAGTHVLTRVRYSRKCLRLIKSEVENFLINAIKDAVERAESKL